MRITLLFCISIVLMCGCSRIKSKYDTVKERIKEEINSTFRTDFYSDPGAWDYYRVPLIAPYELCSTLWVMMGKCGTAAVVLTRISSVDLHSPRPGVL